MKGDPFAGLGSYQAVIEFEWFQPRRLGDRCDILRARVGVSEKASKFGGRTAHVTHDFLFANGAGEMIAVQRGTWINAERLQGEGQGEGARRCLHALHRGAAGRDRRCV